MFAFSGHKKHLGFNPLLAGLEPFRDELEDYETTKVGVLKIRYDEALPTALILKIAKRRVQMVRESESDSFW